MKRKKIFNKLFNSGAEFLKKFHENVEYAVNSVYDCMINDAYLEDIIRNAHK